jgi:F0F1-type ATP synthase assembly protein I
MWRVYLIIALVLGFIVGGLLMLKSTAKTPVPPEIIKRAAERAKDADEE